MGALPELRGSDGMWGRQVVKDFKRSIGTYWVKEMKSLNSKSIATGFFMFFAAITPAVTFGGVYQNVTKSYFGAVEMILATAWCGIFYYLCGGQPVMVNGATGPTVAYVMIIYKMSESWDVPFLTMNAWNGMWMALYMFISAFLDLDRFLLYATRFSDEVFALLIAWIFIFDAIGNPVSGAGVLMYFKENHKSHKKLSSDPNYNIMASALLSVILCFGTTAVAFLLRSIKGGPFCYSPKIRSLLTDFALLTSIFLWTTIDLTVFGDIKTDRLNVPDTFSPTYNCCTEACKTFFPDECPDQSEAWGRRPWVVNLFDNNGKTWLPFATAGTALLGFVLVYLDDGITWHLLNHPSHKLTHGDAMTYDTCLIGIMMIVNANLGLPIVVASTVPCLNHLHALSTKDSKGNIVKVQQTRWSGLIISILMCCSLFALPLLKLIPVPVLLGVFLFMGLVSLGTNQLYGRFLMFFMQPSKYPKEPYTLHMKKSKMHTFTAIQLIIFAGLYVVIATKTLAITFPFFILACIPIRLYILPKYFTEEELLFIDSDEDAINEFLTNQNMHESTARGFQNAKLHKADVTGGMDVEKGEKTLAAGGESDSDDALAENS